MNVASEKKSFKIDKHVLNNNNNINNTNKLEKLLFKDFDAIIYF